MAWRDTGKIAIIIGLFLFLVLLGTGLVPIALASPMAQETPNVAVPAGTVTPTASRAPQPGDQSYVVEPGDTLSKISAKFYNSSAKYGLIQRANNLPDNAVLRVGMSLIIPAQSDAEALLPSKASVPTSTPFAVSPVPSKTALPPNSPTATVPSPVLAPVDPQPPSGTGQKELEPLIPIIVLALDTLSAICFLGSLSCAYLAFDAYRRSRYFVKRRAIGLRVRVGL